MEVYMRFIVSLICSLLISFVFADRATYNFNNIRPAVNSSTQEIAVKNLIERLIKYKVKYFNISIDDSLFIEGKDVFKIFKPDGSSIVDITASSGVAAAWGFHHYLKYYCNCHVSWDGDQLSLPDVLPSVNETVIANDRFRYYQNVCTASYSFVWWSAERWTREIDWMAMNGINLALAFTGQEEIWRRVYIKLGMNSTEINEYFAGPAFLAWGRMGNIRGWGGPLTTSWHKYSVELQLKILEQMRHIGITPVLPAFAGQVPRAFKRLFPNSELEAFGKWNKFPDQYCCPYLLSPVDPLFQTVGKQFLEEYISEFGTDHVYNCDTFNEMLPPSGDIDYLRSVGKNIYNAMLSADNQAIWLLQGWLFHHDFIYWTNERAKAFLTSVPIGKMIVLDLQAELNPQYKRLDSFFGQPFIWCMLHNFGGTLGMHGSVIQVNEGPFEARNLVNSTLVGTGLTPEGINQNYAMYDLMNEMAWRKEPLNLSKWFDDYSVRRYGIENLNAKQFWQLLRESVYNYKGNVAQHGKYIFVHSPNLHLKPNLWYEKSYVINAWDECIKVLETWPDNVTQPDTFLYDIVDLSRQSLQLLLDDSYTRIVNYFKTKNITQFSKEYITFFSLLESMEELLSSHKAFLLKPWIESAKSLASSSNESELYEINARNQITLWGPNGEIKDYANKQWAGLIHHYYYQRWKLFFGYAEKCLINHTNFNQTEIEEKIFEEVEHDFSFHTGPIIENYTGNASQVVKKIYSIWRTTFMDSVISVDII